MAATDITTAAAIVPRSRSATGLTRRAARRPLPVLGSALLIVLILSALFAPWLTPYDPFEMNVVDRLLPPNETYWFGTDAYGRDIFTRTLYGGRVSLVRKIS